LKRAGAHFLLNDLSWEEWQSLILLESVKAEIEEKQQKDAEMKQLLARAQTPQTKVR